MPRRRSRPFMIVELDFFNSDPRYTGLELEDQQRYLRLWARSKRTRHEVIPNVDTVTADGRRALTRLLRTSTRSLDATLARLTAPGAPSDPLISVTKRGYIRVYGCSKVHGVDRNSVHYVDPDVDSDSYLDSERDSVDPDSERPGADTRPGDKTPQPRDTEDKAESTAPFSDEKLEANDTPDTAPATEPEARQPTPEEIKAAQDKASKSPHAWIRDASKRAQANGDPPPIEELPSDH